MSESDEESDDQETIRTTTITTTTTTFKHQQQKQSTSSTVGVKRRAPNTTSSDSSKPSSSNKPSPTSGKQTVNKKSDVDSSDLKPPVGKAVKRGAIKQAKTSPESSETSKPKIKRLQKENKNEMNAKKAKIDDSLSSKTSIASFKPTTSPTNNQQQPGGIMAGKIISLGSGFKIPKRPSSESSKEAVDVGEKKSKLLTSQSSLTEETATSKTGIKTTTTTSKPNSSSPTAKTAPNSKLTEPANKKSPHKPGVTRKKSKYIFDFLLFTILI